MNVGVVEDHGNFVRQDDRVVDGLGAVHQRVIAAAPEGRGRLVAERGEGGARFAAALFCTPAVYLKC